MKFLGRFDAEGKDTYSHRRRKTCGAADEELRGPLHSHSGFLGPFTPKFQRGSIDHNWQVGNTSRCSGLSALGLPKVDMSRTTIVTKSMQVFCLISVLVSRQTQPATSPRITLDPPATTVNSASGGACSAKSYRESHEERVSPRAGEKQRKPAEVHELCQGPAKNVYRRAPCRHVVTHWIGNTERVSTWYRHGYAVHERLCRSTGQARNSRRPV
jgi:hypothetical protein